MFMFIWIFLGNIMRLIADVMINTQEYFYTRTQLARLAIDTTEGMAFK